MFFVDIIIYVKMHRTALKEDTPLLAISFLRALIRKKALLGTIWLISTNVIKHFWLQFANSEVNLNSNVLDSTPSQHFDCFSFICEQNPKARRNYLQHFELRERPLWMLRVFKFASVLPPPWKFRVRGNRQKISHPGWLGPLEVHQGSRVQFGKRQHKETSRFLQWISIIQVFPVLLSETFGRL